jgi:hypothetical protein
MRQTLQIITLIFIGIMGISMKSTGYLLFNSPENNNCVDAVALDPDSTNHTGTLIGATESEAFSGGCDDVQPSAGGDVWYLITTNEILEERTLEIFVQPNGSMAINAYLYSGNCDELVATLLTCEQGGNGQEVFLSWQILPFNREERDYGSRSQQEFLLRIRHRRGPVGDFTINIDGSALPIQIASINAAPKGQFNLISWSTASEINNHVQIVERSSGAMTSWDEVGRVEGTNTNKLTHYEVLDKNPENLNYYRIKSVDFDGKLQYSPIVSVVRDGNSEVGIKSLYPNPAQEQLNVELYNEREEEVRFRVTDLSGKMISEFKQFAKTGNTLYSLDVSSLPAGSYLLLSESASMNQSKKFIKQ